MNAIKLVFENGILQQPLSDHENFPKTVIFHHQDHIAIRLVKQAKLTVPIYLKFINNGAEVALNIHIVAEEHSEAVILEEYTEGKDHCGKTAANIQFDLHPHARIHYYKLQNENLVVQHSAEIAVTQMTGSEAHLFFADCGSQSAHETIKVKLTDCNAICHLKGLYFLRADQQVLQYKINVEHEAEYGESSMLFKGILDKKSQALFHGKVHIKPQAQYSKTTQANHHLLLSQYAEAKSEPHLEIYADEVKCAHGATIGQIDHESLFYLRSRGIELPQAFQMLTQAFAFDVINKIEDLNIRKCVQERVIPYAEF